MQYATKFALLFSITTYIAFALLAKASFGENLHPSIFENLKTEDSLISKQIRVLFLLIFLCNMPFIFFPGRDGILVILDEVKNKAMSKEMKKVLDVDAFDRNATDDEDNDGY